MPAGVNACGAWAADCRRYCGSGPCGGWCCAACTRRIAPVAAATTFDGGHLHRFRNPHGLEFTIGLWSSAPGRAHRGDATEHSSWFPGSAWRVAECAGCAAHLGWLFGCVGSPGPGEPAGFHGLIRARLRPGS